MQVMRELDHPFMPKVRLQSRTHPLTALAPLTLAALRLQLYATFRDAAYIYFLTDYYSGGDLLSLTSKHADFPFSVDAVRFYAANVVVIFEYLHNRSARGPLPRHRPAPWLCSRAICLAGTSSFATSSSRT